MHGGDVKVGGGCRHPLKGISRSQANNMHDCCSAQLSKSKLRQAFFFLRTS